MCSVPEPPTAGSEVAFVIKNVSLKSHGGLVEMLVDMGCEGKGVPGRRSDQTACDQITSNGHSPAHRVPGSALPRRKFKSPPYKLETCFIANILPFEAQWSEQAIIFLKSVLDKQMSGLVEDVLMPDRIILVDIPFISKFLSRGRMAKKIEAGHFKSLVLSSLQSPEGQPSTPCSLSPEPTNAQEAPGRYLYLELQPDLFENVEVTQVTDPLSLFCKLCIFSKELKKLFKHMQLHYDGSSVPGPGRPRTGGSPCATRGTDGTWHRSLLTQDVASGTGSVEVLHVDHGKTEMIPMSDIRHLHENFLRIPVVTYHCAIDGVHAAIWRKDQIDDLKSLLRHAIFARFERYDAVKNIYDVTFFGVEAECINAYFAEKSEVLSDSRHASKDSAADDCTAPPGTDDVDKSFSIKVDLTTIVRGSMSPKSENPPANRRTDDDKCVDKKYWPNLSPIRLENAYSVIQNGHASPQSPGVTKNTICELFLPVGSCVAVKVSFIESPAMFFCQILDNQESLMDLMKDLKSYYDNSSVEKLVDDFCVARHPDNHMWYRGRVIDHRSMMDVRFIDYGQTRMVPVQDLRPVDPRFMHLNAQAFRCCLHNPLHSANPSAAHWTDGATEQFHKFIDTTDFSNGELKCTVKATTRNPQGLVCSVVDVRTPLQSVFNLVTQTTVSQCVDPLEASPVPLVTPGYSCSTHDLEVGSRENVCIMGSVSVDHFYCQLSRNSGSLARITEGVRQLLASQPRSTGLPLVDDSACIARYTDNKWYRGQIKTTHPKLQVYFVDFGDLMSLKMSDVCPVPVECSMVRSLPAQAIEVGLFNVPADVPKEINDWFEEHAVGHCFTISVVKKVSGGKLLVELIDGTQNVNLAVKERTVMAKNKSGSHPLSVSLPSSSVKQSTPEIPVDHSKMLKRTISEPKMSTRQQHEVCSRNGLQVEVDHKTSGPSVPCASVDAGKRANPSVEPRNTVRNATLADLPSRLLERGSSSAVHICHFNSPSSFFVQLQQDENDIYAVTEKLNDPGGVFSGPVQFSNLNVSDLISAEFPGDSSWYRAAVGKKLDDETLAVQFIDFGNEATVACVKTCYLDEELLAQPRFSIPCTFGAMNHNQEQWDQEAIAAFKNATVENPEKTYSCTFMEETESVWDIVLEDQGIVLAQTLIQKTQTGSNLTQTDFAEETYRYMKPDIVPHGPCQAYATCIVGPHFFWCQHKNTAVLDKVSKLVEEAARLGEQDPAWVETLRLDSPCLALFTDDNRWYRAQVIRRTDDALSVLFIDYGNEAEVGVSCVKAVPRFLFEMPPQAFLCALEGFDESKGDWEERASDEFYELLVEKVLSVTPLTVGDNLYTAIPQYAVTVELGETVVNKAMENYWKGSGEMDGDISAVQSSPVAHLCQEPSDEHQHPTKLLNAFTEW